ncbi:MAG: rod shape-determining protein MreC, partial [Oscillospiraceae bacterium]
PSRGARGRGDVYKRQGVYPRGLVVGAIRTLYVEEDGISRHAQVEPSADIDGVRYVYVIVDYGG